MRTPQKILVIRLSSLGDILLTSPVVRCLKMKYPASQIDFLIKSEYADLYRFNPNVTTLRELSGGGKIELRSIKEKIRSTRYDIIVDLHNSLRSRYLRFFSMSRYTKVIKKKIFKRLLLVKFGIDLFDDLDHVIGRYFETVKNFGVKDDGKGPEMFIPGEVSEIAANMTAGLNLDQHKHVFGFAPSARHFTKIWPAERFVDLGVELTKEFQAKIIIFGGKEEKDYCEDISQMIKSKSGHNSAVNYAGKLNLLETAAVLDRCDQVITNDSGVMHMAAARKRKTVAIFGSTVRHLGFAPAGTEHVIVESSGVKCRPCSHIGKDHCPKGHFNCMKEISVDKVRGAVRILAEK